MAAEAYATHTYCVALRLILGENDMILPHIADFGVTIRQHSVAYVTSVTKA